LARIQNNANTINPTDAALAKTAIAVDDDPVVIAKRLTLAIWRSNTGGDASGGFNRQLSYPEIRVV
jgi:hypothetical protein